MTDALSEKVKTTVQNHHFTSCFLESLMENTVIVPQIITLPYND